MPSTRARQPGASQPGPKEPRSARQRGQLLVVFVLSIFVLTGFIALVIDVSWYWSNSLRVQRAADAAALAGAVDLPGNPGTVATHPLGTGIGDALAEASKNGYAAGGGVTITALQDSVANAGGNANQMDVTISAPISTFFMRIFGVSSIAATRSSKALFTLPVPMGSPENYYGNFGVVRNATFTQGGVKTTTNVALTGPGTACANGATNCYKDTGGQLLNPRGFWATMNSEGAENINGDAYQPYYDSATGSPAKACGSTGTLSAQYCPTTYYNYGIEMPPNTTGGYVYVFDPGFCATTLASGTGDRWFGSGSVSSWYELFGINNTPYDLGDDSLIATSGSLFQDQNASDSTMGGSGGSECKQTNVPYGTYPATPKGLDFHDSWYLLNPGNPLSGGPDGTVYRLHTTTTAPAGQSDPVNQKNSNAENSFAIFANDTEGTVGNGLLPTVYGLGAMQMFTPLSSSGGAANSSFYLAQVPQVYGGKVLELNLWDPGDTSPLTATLYVMIPTSSGWTPTPFTYSAATGTTNSGKNSNCNSNANNSPSNNSVVTSTGASLGLFNGCWLTLDVPIPSGYQAYQSGWWQIKYSMTGNGTSSDVTTWTAQILGNPVHLIVP